MTNHLQDNIDQNFPPEPPDDPRPDPTPPPDDALREALADYAHEAWSGWMNYLLGKSTINDDGTWTIPQWATERWYRQMTTPYHLLSENEKASDRDEADKMLAILADSSAVALLRAVERLNDADALTGLHRTMSRAWRVNTTEYIAEAAGLADALIALAAQLEES